MSQNAVRQQLYSPDPKERFQAVKKAAQRRDLSVLDVIAQMAASDPDEQVRAVASRARQYLGGEQVETPPAKDETKEKPKDKPQERVKDSTAQEYIDAAMSYHIAGQREKALKALGKVLQVAPSMAADQYYISVMNDITGLDTEESLELLRSKSRIKEISVSERQLEREKRLGDHLKDVEKSTWVSAMMDMTIYTMIVIFGTLFTVLAVGQSAAGTLSGHEAALDAYFEQLAAGNRDAKPVEELDPELRLLANEWSSIGLSAGLILGVVAGVSSLVGLLIQLVVVHGVARLIFKGQGTLPYLIYRITSLYNIRLPIMFLIAIIGIAATFSGGLGVLPMIFAGILGLFSLGLTFSTIKRVSSAYNFGFAGGCLSVLISGVILSVLSFVLQMLLFTTLVELAGLPL